MKPLNHHHHLPSLAITLMVQIITLIPSPRLYISGDGVMVKKVEGYTPPDKESPGVSSTVS